MKRCAWATREPLISYHDKEWGAPRHGERTHFEFLVLEGAQAGLSRETILRRRAAYRNAFARAKITSAITNAKAFLAVAKEHGTFDAASGSSGRRSANRSWRRWGCSITTKAGVSGADAESRLGGGYGG